MANNIFKNHITIGNADNTSRWIDGTKEAMINIPKSLDSTTWNYLPWIRGSTKNGNISFSTYPGNDGNDTLYIGYAAATKTDNSFDKSLTWNGSTGVLETTKFRGPLEGNAQTATTSIQSQITSINIGDNENYYLNFTDMTGGSQSIKANEEIYIKKDDNSTSLYIPRVKLDKLVVGTPKITSGDSGNTGNIYFYNAGNSKINNETTYGTLTTKVLTGNRIYSLPDETGTIALKENTLGIYYTALDFTKTNEKPGVYSLNRDNITNEKNPVTNKEEYGSILNFAGGKSDQTYYAAQLIISSASGADKPVHAYIRRQTSTSAWSNWSTLLDDKNYTDYTVQQNGTGATGDNWNISILGNAASLNNVLEIGKGGTGSGSQTANKIVYTNDNAKIISGYHYADSTHIAIKDTNQPDTNFYVNGTSKFNGATTVNSTLTVADTTTLNGKLNINGNIIIVSNNYNSAFPTATGEVGQIYFQIIG